MKVALLGRTETLISTGNLLREHGHSVAAVITSSSEPHYSARVTDFERFAARQGAIFRSDGHIGQDDIDKMLGMGVHVGISINWPRKIGEDVLSQFQFGVLNGHAGDLPRYRGNACMNWAILKGEPQVAVVVHGMRGDEIDRGPIYARRRRQLSDRDYISDLYDWLNDALPQLFCDVVNAVSASGVLPKPLDPGAGPEMRCYPRRPSDSEIYWAQSADAIARLVRASSRPLAGAFTTFRGNNFRVWRAEPVETSLVGDFCAVAGQVLSQEGSRLLVACGSGALRIQEWTLDGQVENLPRFNALCRLGS